jgi:threonine efflux protein
VWNLTLWRSKSQALFPSEPSFHPSFPAAFTRGLLTNLSNPKSVVYFSSVFALFMGPTTPFWVKSLAIGIVLMDTILWYGAVAAMFSRVKVQAKYAALEKPINRTTSAVMIGFGARLLVVRD